MAFVASITEPPPTATSRSALAVARGLGASHHVLTRAVRTDGGKGAGVARAERLLKALQRTVLFACERAGRGQEHTFGADAIRFGKHCLARRCPEHHALLRLDVKHAGGELAHGVGSVGSNVTTIEVSEEGSAVLARIIMQSRWLGSVVREIDAITEVGGAIEVDRPLPFPITDPIKVSRRKRRASGQPTLRRTFRDRYCRR